MDRKELLESLYKVKDLYNRLTYLHRISLKENYVKDRTPLLKLINYPPSPECPKEVPLPIEVAKYDENDMQKEEKEIKGKAKQKKLRKFAILLGMFIAFYILAKLKLNIICYLIGFGGFYVLFTMIKDKGHTKQAVQHLQAKKEEYDSYLFRAKKHEDYLKSKETFDINYGEYKKQCSNIREKNLLIEKEHAAKVQEIELEYENAIEGIRKERSEISKELDEYNDIYPSNYYEELPKIIELIENMRADDVKTALNIYESDKRQEELIEAQQEANRIEQQRSERESEDRRAALNFQIDMERRCIEREKEAARKEEEYRNKELEQRRREEVLKEQKLKDEEKRQRDKANQRCRYCAYRSSCRTIGTINCAAYKPK